MRVAMELPLQWQEEKQREVLGMQQLASSYMATWLHGHSLHLFILNQYSFLDRMRFISRTLASILKSSLHDVIQTDTNC